jgi:Domain of unknown function (DUF3372)
MRVDDTVGEDVDPALAGVLVVFNMTPNAISEIVDGMAGHKLELSEVQANGSDDAVRPRRWMWRMGR